MSIHSPLAHKQSHMPTYTQKHTHTYATQTHKRKIELLFDLSENSIFIVCSQFLFISLPFCKDQKRKYILIETICPIRP